MSKDNLTERLSRLDTCAVSDALDRLGMPGVVLGLRPMTVIRRVAGRVITSELGPVDGRVSTRHLGTAAIDAATPGDVIVMAHKGRLDAAGWGGLLSLGAVKRGVAGVIVDGAARDIDESREYDLPVYARAAVPLTARGRVIEVGWNEKVQVGTVDVAPGDLVLADSSGVLFLPADKAQEVIAVAEEIAAREQAMAQAVREGKLMAQVMGASYENLASKQR
jgi:4-hydroxy-4-methyl-2-oxoglutarate aldolase